jgi:hypothetical protein
MGGRICTNHLDHLLRSSLLYWSTGLITQFLDLSQAVGLLGRVISSSQGLYLNTGQHKHRKIRTHIKHPSPGWDSKPQSRPPNDRWLFKPQTARLPRPAFFSVTVPNLPGTRKSTLIFSNEIMDSYKHASFNVRVAIAETFQYVSFTD